jgi:predicted amidohydrolase
MQPQSAISNQQSAIRVAAIQMQVISGEPKKNMVRAEALLNEAAAAGAQAALIP